MRTPHPKDGREVYAENHDLLHEIRDLLAHIVQHTEDTGDSWHAQNVSHESDPAHGGQSS